jgi:hypothetical protein
VAHSTLDATAHRRVAASVAPSSRPLALETRRVDRLVSQALALVTLFLLGMRQSLPEGLTTGFLAAFVLAPMWWPSLKHYRGARLLMTVGAVCAVSGVWLTEVSAVDHALSRTNLVQTTMLLLGTLAGVGVFLWARRMLPVHQVGIAFGLGFLVDGVTSGQLGGPNPWKYALGIPLAVLLLSVLNRPGRRAREVAALLLLAATSALQDSRSYFATFLLAAAVVAWQLRPTTPSRRSSVVGTLAFTALVGTAVYNAGTALILEGYLGEDVQQRSIEQIDASGSLLLGGRPELMATLSLMAERPYGYGTGALPNLQDVLVAKSAMAEINYNPNNGYVENFMFGTDFKLHSMVGELWADFGIAGLALAVFIGAAMIHALATLVARRQASAIVAFLAFFMLWNFLFSPVFGSTPTIILGLGLGLLAKDALPGPPPTTTGHQAAPRDAPRTRGGQDAAGLRYSA